jgi:hypothetical protein
MRTRPLLLARIAIAMAAVGCGSSQPVAAVKVAAEAPAGCKSLGAVEASASGGHNDDQNAEAARQRLLAQAAELGANVLVIEKERSAGMMSRASGRAYQCPSSP